MALYFTATTHTIFEQCSMAELESYFRRVYNFDMADVYQLETLRAEVCLLTRRALYLFTLSSQITLPLLSFL